MSEQVLQSITNLCAETVKDTLMRLIGRRILKCSLEYALEKLEEEQVNKSKITGLNRFFMDCLELQHMGNSQDHPYHEQQVEDLLKKHGFKYEYQPNGTHKSPDFRIHHNDKPYDIECKSSNVGYPVYNGGLPKEGVIYIFSSRKYNETTVFFAEDVVTDYKRVIYTEFLKRQNELLQEYRTREEWQDDERGFDFYCRSMYTQSGGKSKTDYFTHAKRRFCEDRVVNYDF